MFVRMAKTRKTFMLTISQNGRHTHETLGQYPGLAMPRRGRAGNSRAGPSAGAAPVGNVEGRRP